MPRASAIRWAATRIVSLPTSGSATSGRRRRRRARVPGSGRPSGGCTSPRSAGAGPVVPVDVAQVRNRVRRLDPQHLVLERGWLAELRDHVRQAAGVAPCSRSSRAAWRETVTCVDLVSAALELPADDAVELALVGHQAGQQEAHRVRVVGRAARQQGTRRAGPRVISDHRTRDERASAAKRELAALSVSASSRVATWPRRPGAVRAYVDEVGVAGEQAGPACSFVSAPAWQRRPDRPRPPGTLRARSVEAPASTRPSAPATSTQRSPIRRAGRHPMAGEVVERHRR